MVYILGQKETDYSAPIIFLDIDGVLNNLNVHAEGKVYIKPECMAQLNFILQETKANLVISSAWRYLIVPETMTLDGFKYMLTTHGLRYDTKLIGKTGPDGGQFGDDRAKQILWWLSDHYDFKWAVREEMKDPLDADKGVPAWQVEQRASANSGGIPPHRSVTCPPWIAIDDTFMPSLKPLNMVLIQAKTGLTERDADRAIMFLNQQKEKRQSAQ